MNMTPIGKVAVPTSGTPVPLSTDPTARIAHIYFQAVPGLTGNMYIGSPGMVIATLAGVARIISPDPTGGTANHWDIEPHAGEDHLYLNQFAIDAEVSGEGLLITYFVE